MRHKKKDSHEFSLYWPELFNVSESLQVGQSFCIDDPLLCHRMVRVLRLKEEETCILFDKNFHISVELKEIRSKNSICVTVQGKNLNVKHAPNIIFFLPLLKRDALERAIYSLVELGATEIQLMLSQKVQRKWGGQKELDRLHTIMIAAAEQSKQYIIPTLYTPKPFLDCVTVFNQTVPNSFFFDPQGKELFPVLESLRKHMPEAVSLMIGPEGDLTFSEKQTLKESDVQFCRLTPTILRAQQAVVVALGIFRSLVS